MTPQEDPGMLTWVADKAWGVFAALIAVVWGTNQAMHKATRQEAADALAEHQTVDDEKHGTFRAELDRQRDYIAKIFDKLEEHGRRQQENHVQLLQTIHQGLSQKADK